MTSGGSPLWESLQMGYPRSRENGCNSRRNLWIKFLRQQWQSMLRFLWKWRSLKLILIPFQRYFNLLSIAWLWIQHKVVSSLKLSFFLIIEWKGMPRRFDIPQHNCGSLRHGVFPRITRFVDGTQCSWPQEPHRVLGRHLEAKDASEGHQVLGFGCQLGEEGTIWRKSWDHPSPP